MIQRLEVRETSAHELGEWAAMRAEMMLEIGLIGATEVDSFRTTAGSPVATSGVTIYTSPPHPRYEGREAYLMSMFVRPAFRRQGIGTAILIASIKAAKIAGARNIWLLATDAGAPLYRRHGFESRSEYMALVANR
ncbi:MAG: GNAT family N-acetyltransferase [Chloroflexi bacterium]|nr:MAG: GNAT family N-acetyltransferase [Chloroflexota bacterium]